MSRTKNTNGKHAARSEKIGATAQGAYFLSLSLENVRCFGPKQTLDLSDGNGKPARWTIILGVNGTGKTTTLQSLAAFELLKRSDVSPGEHWTPRFFNLSSIETESYQRGERKEAAVLRVGFALSDTITGTPLELAEHELRVNPKGKVFKTQYDHLTGAAVDPPRCCAYGAGRRMGAGSFSQSESDDATASLFSDKADLRNPEEWLLRLDYGASKPSGFQKIHASRLEQAKEILLSILWEIDDIRFVTASGTNPSSRVEFKTHYGWVPLRRLGYGYGTLITWVADLVNRMFERYPDSTDSLAEPAVVLVDEIDLHLHPVWQRDLISRLTERFPNTQFIATAHSPLMVQAAADANLAVLRREGDHVIIDNDVENIRNWRIDQILTSDLFGLETARPPQIEKLMAERNKLLDKPKLTAVDKHRLKEIEAEIGELPYGETPQERREREEIRKTLDLLLKERKSAQ